MEEVNNIVGDYKRMSFAHLKKNILQDLINNKSESVVYKRYSKSEVISMLENPQRNEKQIRELSNYLYIISSSYRRLVDYMSTILLYNYIVIPSRIKSEIDKEKYTEDYLNICNECDKYNLKHENKKMIKIAVREGVFFGISFESDESFYIKPVQAQYAQISGIEDGCYTFKFDLNFFNSNKDLLPMYGTEFQNAVLRYKGDRERGIEGDKKLRWYEPKNGICIKADESDPYHSLPMFTGLLLSIFDIEDYKMLKKAKAENDNYKALSLKIPTDEDGVPLLSYEENEDYFNHVVDNIDNDGVGVFMTPFTVTDFSFASSATSADTDDVANAENEFWYSSGVSPLLFGSSKGTSSSSIAMSVKTDEALAYSILIQIERFFNKKIKKMNLDNGFKIKFSSASIFNQDEYTNRLKTAGALGLPVKMQYASHLNMSPVDIIGETFIEEEVLKLGKDKWINPLISSNTQSSIDESGRPSSTETGTQIGDAGEATQNSDGND